MDGLLSAFNAYDFFGYILSGGLFLAGADWAFEGELMPMTAIGALGFVGFAYLAGHAIQAVANIAIEPVLWWDKRPRYAAARLLLGTSSHRRSLSPRVQEELRAELAQASGMLADDMTDHANERRFATARAMLRARGQDARSELMNAMYGLCRGATTACIALVLVCIAAGFVVDGAWPRLSVAIAICALAAFLLGMRARRFGFHFAEQVLVDVRLV